MPAPPFPDTTRPWSTAPSVKGSISPFEPSSVIPFPPLPSALVASASRPKMLSRITSPSESGPSAKSPWPPLLELMTPGPMVAVAALST